MIDALLGKPRSVTVNGATFYLTRPTMGDLVAAQHETTKGDDYHLRRWMLWNHLRNADLTRVLEKPDDVDRIDAGVAIELLGMIDELWSEGRD